MTARTSLRVVSLVFCLVVAALLLRDRAEQLPRLLAWVRGQGAVAPLIYTVLYTLAVPLLVPGSLLSLAAGALFGIVPGLLVVFTGSTLGSSLAFLIARYGARPWVQRAALSYPRFAAIDRAVATDGARLVFLLRLTPLVPFTLLNYLLGITSLRYRDLLAAAPGTLPGTCLYVYYGHVIGDVTAVAAGVVPPHGPLQYALLTLGVGAAALVAWRVSRLAQRALAEARVYTS